MDHRVPCTRELFIQVHLHNKSDFNLIDPPSFSCVVDYPVNPGIASHSRRPSGERKTSSLSIKMLQSDIADYKNRQPVIWEKYNTEPIREHPCAREQLEHISSPAHHQGL